MPPPRNMQSRATKSSGGGSPPTRGRGVTPPAAMVKAGKIIIDTEQRVQPSITAKDVSPRGYSGGDR